MAYVWLDRLPTTSELVAEFGSLESCFLFLLIVYLLEFFSFTVSLSFLFPSLISPLFLVIQVLLIISLLNPFFWYQEELISRQSSIVMTENLFNLPFTIIRPKVQVSSEFKHSLWTITRSVASPVFFISVRLVSYLKNWEWKKYFYLTWRQEVSKGDNAWLSCHQILGGLKIIKISNLFQINPEGKISHCRWKLPEDGVWLNG